MVVASRAAFTDLGAVPGAAGMAASRQRQGGDDRGIGRAPGDDDIGAGGERGLHLLGPGEGDDIAAGADRIRVDLGRGGQGDDPAGGEGVGDICSGSWPELSRVHAQVRPSSAASSQVIS